VWVSIYIYIIYIYIDIDIRWAGTRGIASNDEEARVAHLELAWAVRAVQQVIHRICMAQPSDHAAATETAWVKRRAR
jgi:hypothetical protein